MPDLYLDSVSFGSRQPTVNELVSAGVRGILGYSRVSNPPFDYMEECVARGVSFNPIFETAGTRAFGGYQPGRDDGAMYADDLHHMGIPDGVRCFVNMADTPSVPDEYIGAVIDYAAGFAETFPANWQLGSYGAEAALYAALRGNGRFDKLWAVEPWYAGAGQAGQYTVEEHWNYWQGRPNVVLVQMANVPPQLAGTDTNWLIPGQTLDGWGGTPPTLHGFRYPLDGPMRVNSPWGMRNGKMHWGIDLWAEPGVPCYAVRPGDVIEVAYEQYGGNVVALAFDVPPVPAAPHFGYMHLERAAVTTGQHVETGDLIGYCDSTGEGVTGSHLHFWIGANANVGAIDPTPFLLAGPSTQPDFNHIEETLKALGGNNAMIIPNFLGYEITMLVNDDGELIHNARTFYGVPSVTNEVLARGCDRAVQPDGRVDGQHLIVVVASNDGRERRIVFLAERGGWVTDPNNVEWNIGAQA